MLAKKNRTNKNEVDKIFKQGKVVFSSNLTFKYKDFSVDLSIKAGLFRQNRNFNPIHSYQLFVTIATQIA